MGCRDSSVDGSNGSLESNRVPFLAQSCNSSPRESGALLVSAQMCTGLYMHPYTNNLGLKPLGIFVHCDLT